MTNKLLLFLAFTGAFSTHAQIDTAFVDSIRRVYDIPEIGYAVVSSTGIFEQQTLGIKKTGTPIRAEITDQFRIGSNTKAITGFIAALLIKEHQLSWETKFFDLFPELKAKADPVHYDLTLLQLLSFRTQLFPYTYTYKKPKKNQFSGTEAEQRYQFAEWFFRQPPVSNEDTIHFSNLGYVAAGMMLEKASGKSYKELVGELGKQLGITFCFGQPNMLGDHQPWGHNAQLEPEPPQENHKLSWLLPAGNITLSLPDYAKFIQLQLQGLNGESDWLTKEEFEFLHFGQPRFSIGWFAGTNDDGERFSFNTGNPGTFLSQVVVFPGKDRAFILFSNAQTDKASEGLAVLYEALYQLYK